MERAPLVARHVRPGERREVVEEIRRLTDGRGVDVAIESLGTQGTFEGCLRVLRPGGTLSSLSVYSQDLKIPLDAFASGLGDHQIVSSLCPGGKERMRRLMGVIAGKRTDLRRWSSIASSWTRSKRRPTCSPTSATAC